MCPVVYFSTFFSHETKTNFLSLSRVQQALAGTSVNSIKTITLLN